MQLTSTEPIFYGWRYVKREKPDGTYDLEEVPLTLGDVLHPQEGDVIPERPIHERECEYLSEVFDTRPLTPPFVHVSADQLIDWGVEGMRPTSPDVAVFVGLAQEADLNEGTFRLAESGGRCLLALEVVSPDTRKNDVIEKVDLYHRAKVPLYVILDWEKVDQPRRLLAYRWRPAGYEVIPLDAQGRLFLSALNLHLSIRDDRALCQDSETGRALGNYTQVMRDLEEMERRDQDREREMEDTVLRAHDAEATARDEAKARKIAETCGYWARRAGKVGCCAND